MGSQQSAQARDKAMRKTSVVGAIVNLLLTIAKVIFGIIGQSQALIADGVHSLADLSTDLIVWLAAKYSNRPADNEHPYGHARIETAFTVGLGVVLIITAIGIAVDSAQRLLNPETLLQPTQIVLLIAALSIFANEGLYHYTIRAARACKSSLLTANAWHHRSDAISSIVVLIGVAGSLLGLPYLDAFAALGVALMIGKIGWGQVWTSIRELVDTGMEPKAALALTRILEAIDGVRGVHMLRSRRMGGVYLIDVHILVDERLSVSEGHRIAEYVRLKLIDSHEDISNALVHIDPEDDSVAMLCADLPLRREVLTDLRKVWANDIDLSEFDKVILHYLNGKVHVDLVCSIYAVNANVEQLSERLQENAKALNYIGDVRVYRQL
ncbi:cation diffusion facilitator family transporter [Candidatus Nitrotoga sp. M5]|uniref:cation diffusion facilitator family transporter n=1 Tax=Candidatus Nitrotoga sp. M5 TaxID=2890409 RepID=UPI001EF2BF43|nr:cation diffusion facilitator family transporter [Candidatus Nitrotoga sp. M5]CAH1386985.1 Cobalt-zinc-cadmium resistance protein [Candidatus Nitrotoga sp. M5]